MTIIREINRYLQNLEFQTTGRDPKTNGFAYAKVPEWQLRQWFSALSDAYGTESSLLAWLAGEHNLEISYQCWDEDACWQVHSINGGRNDREWTLLAEGSTPAAAIAKAQKIREEARAVTRYNREGVAE